MESVELEVYSVEWRVNSSVEFSRVDVYVDDKVCQEWRMNSSVEWSENSSVEFSRTGSVKRGRGQ